MEQSEHKFSAACYCRLSKDDENDGTSVSIETQQQILSDYCRENNLNIYNFYCDDGYSGVNFDRPGYKRMMSDIDKGLINAVVVKDLSRFGRNYIEVGKYIEEIFPEMGVRFIAVGDDVDTDKDNIDLDMLLPMKNIFNQFYPADCSRKTRQALRSKALKGEFIGNTAPYGYRKSAADKHLLEIDENTAPIIERIFTLAAYENCGCNKIARILSKEKVMTPSAYAAKLTGRIYNKDPHLFAGLVKCDACGYSLSFSPKKNGRDFLACTTYKRKGKEACSIHFITCSDLYEFVLFDISRQIKAIIKDEKKVAEKLKKRNFSTRRYDLEKSGRDAKNLEKRIKELDDRFYRLYEDNLNGVISEERFIELSRRCEKEQNELKEKLENIRNITIENEETDKNIEAFILLVKEFLDITELDKNIVHRLIDKIVVGDKYYIDDVKKQNIKVYYKFVGEGV